MNERDAPKNISNNCESDFQINQNTIIQHDRKRKSEINESTMAKVLKNNYYSPLATEDECDKEFLEKFEKHVQEKYKPSSSKNSTQNNSTSEERSNANIENIKNNNQNKNKKIPPLNVFDVESNELITFLKNGLKIKNFKLKEFSNKKISLYLDEINDYTKAKAFLEKTNTKFYTYTPKNLKTKTYLLKGLSAVIDTNEILLNLRKYENNSLKFIKVSKFTTKKSINNGYPLNIFLVQVSGESNFNELRAITGILHRCIHWEPLRKPEIPQCRRCQSFFHSASNCFLPPRCVKCDKSHDLGKCSMANVLETEREKLYCVLCNTYGHPASYRGCKIYKELQEKIRAKRQALPTNKNNRSYNLVNPNLSFANVLQNSATQNVDSNNPINLTLKELNNTMSNLSNQILNLQKQLQMQASRINTLFSLISNDNEEY